MKYIISDGYDNWELIAPDPETAIDYMVGDKRPPPGSEALPDYDFHTAAAFAHELTFKELEDYGEQPVACRTIDLTRWEART